MEVYGSTDSRDYLSLLNAIAYSSGIFFTLLKNMVLNDLFVTSLIKLAKGYFS
jgi:hypothetical protein